MKDHEPRVRPEEDPREKALADAIEETIEVAYSIEEEMLIEAAEIEVITYRETIPED